MTERELYLRAAKLLRKDGWCRGRYRRGQRHCMIGAIRTVGGDVKTSEIQNLIGLFTADDDKFFAHFFGGDVIADINDAPDMTAEDAIAALEIAADLAAP